MHVHYQGPCNLVTQLFACYKGHAAAVSKRFVHLM